MRTDLQAEIKTEIAGSEARVHAKIDQFQAEAKADIVGVHTEIANVRAELKTDIGGLDVRLCRQL